MAVQFTEGIEIMCEDPIDTRIVLTKALMKMYEPGDIPDVYFALCLDDQNMYVFDSTATPSAETGYYKLAADPDMGERVDVLEERVADIQTMTSTEIDDIINS